MKIQINIDDELDTVEDIQRVFKAIVEQPLVDNREAILTADEAELVSEDMVKAGLRVLEEYAGVFPAQRELRAQMVEEIYREMFEAD